MHPKHHVDLLAGDKRFTRLCHLGKGAYGDVSLYRWHDPSQHGAHEAPVEVAVKFISLVSNYNFKYLRAEIACHSRLRHDHVIRVYKVGITPDRTHIYMVLEYAELGDLFQTFNSLITRPGMSMPEPLARRLFMQLILGLDYCHKLGIPNRDIKLDNLMVAVLKDGAGVRLRDIGEAPYDCTTLLQALPFEVLAIKLADFGLCKDTDTSAPRSVVGTPAYMAPEVIKAGSGCTYDGMKADLWSCGVILYALLFTDYPFGSAPERKPAEMAQLHRAILGGAYKKPPPGKVSPECERFLARLFVVDPAARMSVEQMVHDPWFSEGLATLGAPLTPDKFLNYNNELVAEASARPKELPEVSAVLQSAEALRAAAMHDHHAHAAGLGLGGAGGHPHYGDAGDVELEVHGLEDLDLHGHPGEEEDLYNQLPGYHDPAAHAGAGAVHGGMPMGPRELTTWMAEAEQELIEEAGPSVYQQD